MLRFEFGSSIRYTQIPVNFIDLVFIVLPSGLFRIDSFFCDGWSNGLIRICSAESAACSILYET